MESRAWVAFTVIGAPGVHASVLAAPVIDLALINICRVTHHTHTHRARKGIYSNCPKGCLIIRKVPLKNQLQKASMC
jgi:hypothetical protein